MTEDHSLSNWSSRLQILNQTFYDGDITLKNIKDVCKKFSMESVHNQGENQVCAIFACLECMDYRYYLDKGEQIHLCVMQVRDTFVEVVNKMLKDQKVSGLTKDVYSKAAKDVESIMRSGPSIAQVFNFIKYDGVYDASEAYPFVLNRNSKVQQLDPPSDWTKFVKYTIEKVETCDYNDLNKATSWLKEGPIVGSIYLRNRSFSNYKLSLHKMFRNHQRYNVKNPGKDAHTLLILGESVLKIEEEEVLCYLVKDTNDTWGYKGFGMVARSEFFMFGRPINVKVHGT